MQELDIFQAQLDLNRLVQLAKEGEEIIITIENKPVAKIVALPKNKRKLKFGSAKNKVNISDNFDDPLEDFAEYS